MKKLMKKLVNGLAVFAVLGISSVAHADDDHGYYDWAMGEVQTLVKSMGFSAPSGNGTGGGIVGPTVPELSLGGLAAGLTLAVGVLIVIGSRRRRVS
jgi:hypothetical protein